MKKSFAFVLPFLFLCVCGFDTVWSKEQRPVSVTAEDALVRLRDGNERFVTEHSQSPNKTLVRVLETAKDGQHPFVTFLSCSDSRVPLEVVFDQGIGDLFVIRVAGNVIGTDEIGSIEYGVEHVGTPLLVVLGHTQCGAVTAAASHAHAEGSITKLVEKIGPAVERAKKAQPDCKDAELVEAAVVQNIWLSIESLFEDSKIVTEMVEKEKLKVVGALYDIQTGKTTWLGEHEKFKRKSE